jgi:hypothetical protein
MKQPINEVRRMQQLANVIEEGQTEIEKVSKSQLKKLINSSLSKEEELKKLESLVSSIENSSISLHKKEGYTSGLADGFRLYSHWIRTQIK